MKRKANAVTSKQLMDGLAEAAAALGAMDSAGDLLRRLQSVGELLRHGVVNVVEVEDNGSVIKAAAVLRSEVDKLSASIRQLQAGDVYDDLTDARTRLSRLPEDFQPLIRPIIDRLGEIRATYNAFLSSHGREPAARLAVVGAELEEEAKRLSLAASVLGGADGIVVDPDDAVLDLELAEVDDSPDQLLERLKAVAIIVSTLAGLLPDVPKIRIVRLEVGSLWLRLLGRTRAISFLRELLERALAFMYRNYTVEGQLEQLPRKVKIAEEILGLEEQLRAQGRDTQAMQRDLEEAAGIITLSFTNLLARTRGARLDNRAFGEMATPTLGSLPRARDMLAPGEDALPTPQPEENAGSDQAERKD